MVNITCNIAKIDLIFPMGALVAAVRNWIGETVEGKLPKILKPQRPGKLHLVRKVATNPAEPRHSRAPLDNIALYQYLKCYLMFSRSFGH